MSVVMGSLVLSLGRMGRGLLLHTAAILCDLIMGVSPRHLTGRGGGTTGRGCRRRHRDQCSPWAMLCQVWWNSMCSRLISGTVNGFSPGSSGGGWPAGSVPAGRGWCPQLGGGDGADRHGHDQCQVPHDRGVVVAEFVVFLDGAPAAADAGQDRQADRAAYGHEAPEVAGAGGVVQVAADQQVAAAVPGGDQGPGVAAVAVGPGAARGDRPGPLGNLLQRLISAHVRAGGQGHAEDIPEA